MSNFFDPGIRNKPDFVECMKRIYAWYDHQVLDRAPVRFSAHNADYAVEGETGRWANLKQRWYDVEYQVEKFKRSVERSSYLGETFPVFFPNLGPNVFAGMLGAHLEFGDVTSWCLPMISGQNELDRVTFDWQSEYLRKINELTDVALEMGNGLFLTGYTDMHPGLDCADALLGTENLFMNIFEAPDFVNELIKRVSIPFYEVMDAFHKKLKAHHQLSVTWMQIPSYETLHIPSCDLGAMISRKMFDEFALPEIQEEVKHFTHNIFHVDGKDVAKHLDALLDIPQIQAYQWVQGVGLDKPILQWVRLIKRIQAAGKSVVVDLAREELEAFMEAVRPEGILLCIDEPDRDAQQAIITKLLSWK